jgi:transcriptional regulator with XRE-family HTH domain
MKKDNDDLLRAIMSRNLKELRRKNGMSQENLATAMGISRVSVCNIELGVQAMTAINIFKFCTIFKCDYSDLFPAPGELKAVVSTIKTSMKTKKLEKINRLKQEIENIEKEL